MIMAELTAASEDYLKYIWSATEWSDEPVKTSRLAKDMGLSPSTVSESVSRLAKDGLVEHEKYHAIRLTADGVRHALAMVRAHRLIETFLHDHLGYSWDEIHTEADSLEHAASPRFIDAIDTLLGHPQYDPHGDPIPDSEGNMPVRRAISLAEAAHGTATVLRIDDADPQDLRAASALGLRPGQSVMISESTIEVDGRKADAAPFEHIVWVTDNRSAVQGR